MAARRNGLIINTAVSPLIQSYSEPYSVVY